MFICLLGAKESILLETFGWYFCSVAWHGAMDFLVWGAWHAAFGSGITFAETRIFSGNTQGDKNNLYHRWNSCSRVDLV